MSKPITTLCYIEQDGKYLMLHRTKKKQDINGGKWIGVGGHLEEGESPEDCLVREVREILLRDDPRFFTLRLAYEGDKLVDKKLQFYTVCTGTEETV